MKNKILLLIIFCTITLSLTASKDTLETSLKIINGKEIFQPKSDFWDKYSSGIIAAITVVVSLIISIWQARVGQRHSRANSIAEARIQWIAELRPLLGQLISMTSEYVNLMQKLEPFIDKSKKDLKILSVEQNKNYETEYGKILIKHEEFKNIFNQIKLFLNLNEKEHLEYIQLVDKYLNNSAKEIVSNDFINTIDQDELVNKAQLILKSAWEQAKNEKNKKSWCKKKKKR